MPNRIIKESICTSDNINQLSAFQETVFYRMIVNCDDYGRLDARPKLLASKLFPLKDIRASQIEDALRALTSAELITLYTVGGQSFLQMKTWDRHQTIRAKKSRYPSPESGKTASASNCTQMQADASRCSRNPIQSESNPNPNPNPNSAGADESAKVEERFGRFWAAYPRKDAKQSALKAFMKLKPDDKLLETMLSAITKQRASPQWARDDGQFIPMAATWLNGRRWEDESSAARPAQPVLPAQSYHQREYSDELPEMPDWLKARLDASRAKEAEACAASSA